MTSRYWLGVAPAMVVLGAAGALKLYDPFQAAGVLGELLNVSFGRSVVIVRLLAGAELLAGAALALYPRNSSVILSVLALSIEVLLLAIALERRDLLGECGCFGPIRLPGGAWAHIGTLGISTAGLAYYRMQARGGR